MAVHACIINMYVYGGRWNDTREEVTTALTDSRVRNNDINTLVYYGCET